MTTSDEWREAVMAPWSDEEPDKQLEVPADADEQNIDDRRRK